MKPQVFISYVREDAAEVARLASALEQHDIKVWYDRRSLRPGERWQRMIKEAIERGDYFIACFSHAYAARMTSYMNEELTLAIEQLRRRSTERTWFIPVLLDAVDIPDRNIGAGESLRDLHAASLADDWAQGVSEIVSVINPNAADTAAGERRHGPAPSDRVEYLTPAERLAIQRAHSLGEMLEDAAAMIAGAPVDGATHGGSLSLRGRLSGIMLQMALEATVSAELVDDRGPQLGLRSRDRDGEFLDLTIANIGDDDAIDVSLLMDGPVLKRGSRTLRSGDTTEIAVRLAATGAANRALVEYADRAPAVYLQRLNDPGSRHRIHRRCLERPKTWYDASEFVVDRLGGEPFPYEISSRHIEVQLDTDPRAAQVLDEVEVSELYREHGFVKLVPAGMRADDLPEYAVMSDRLNAELWRGAGIHAREDPQLLESLELQMRTNAALLIDVLKEKYSRLSDEQRFFNEHKACLGTDVLTASSPVGIFHGTYFHGYLTNELATRRISSRDARPAPLYYGSERTAFGRRGGRCELASIAASGMSNHIGASVLLFTADKRIQYWRQSRGEHNVGKANATGSGSCDWDDWAALGADERTLPALAARAMERELREESGLLGRDMRKEPIDVRLLGYFRWVRRGGKPEFVGIARSGILSTALVPDVTEVDAPADAAFFLEAQNAATLRREIDALLARPAQCALPLWVALTCLRARCDAEDREVERFLWP